MQQTLHHYYCKRYQDCDCFKYT